MISRRTAAPPAAPARLALSAALCLVFAGSAAMFAAAPAAAAPSASPSATATAGNGVDTTTLVNPDGDDALLNLLGQMNVTYYPVTDVGDAVEDAGTHTTLVIDEQESLSPHDLALISHSVFGRVVVLNNDQATLTSLMPGTEVSDSMVVPGTYTTPAGCAAPDAAAAGAVDMDATETFSVVPDGAQGCYRVGSSPSMVFDQDVPTSGDAVALGSSDFITNEDLADAGDAALALRLFGANSNLVWLAPSFRVDPLLNNQGGVSSGSGGGGSNGGGGGSAGGGGGGGGGSAGGGGGSSQGGNSNGSSSSPPSLLSLLPPWVIPVAVQLLLAALLVAYWRGRRLGAVVPEDLPVTVRAAETVEGHARLYRRAGANARAAHLLRRAAAGRIAARLGLPAMRAQADPASLSGPVGARLGVDPELVRDLLAGAVPDSENELVQLADHLDQLEQEVRST